MTNEKKLAQIKRAILKDDPNLALDSDTFKSLTVLVASALVGPNIKRILKLTHIPRAFIAPRSARLRKNGIWVGARVHANWENDGYLGLCLDSLVADGYIEAVPATKGA